MSSEEPIPIQILCMEDDPGAARLLQKRLLRAGWQVDLAYDGTSGIEQSRSKLYDVILIDQEMPGFEGLEVIRLLIAEGGEVPPLIMVTGSGDERTAVEALKLGAMDYVVKDVVGNYLELLPLIIEQTLEKQRLLQAKKEADESIRQYAAELELSNRELDAFAHTVAHDLRNPLNNIGVAIDILEDVVNSLEDAEASQLLKTMRATSKQMASIIDGLLLLAQVRNAAEIVETISLNAIAEAALCRVADRPKARGARIEIMPDLPEAVGYAPWIEEVLANLLDNAIKYIGKVNPDPSIKVSGYRVEDKVYCEVVDNGPGIQAKDLEHLFEMFSRFHRNEASGSGLGLSIIKRIITKLNGEVGVRSTPGEGSTFWFSLPAVKDE